MEKTLYTTVNFLSSRFLICLRGGSGIETGARPLTISLVERLFINYRLAGITIWDSSDH